MEQSLVSSVFLVNVSPRGRFCSFGFFLLFLPEIDGSIGLRLQVFTGQTDTQVGEREVGGTRNLPKLEKRV